MQATRARIIPTYSQQRSSDNPTSFERNCRCENMVIIGGIKRKRKKMKEEEDAEKWDE